MAKRKKSFPKFAEDAENKSWNGMTQWKSVLVKLPHLVYACIFRTVLCFRELTLFVASKVSSLKIRCNLENACVNRMWQLRFKSGIKWPLWTGIIHKPEVLKVHTSGFPEISVIFPNSNLTSKNIDSRK